MFRCALTLAVAGFVFAFSALADEAAAIVEFDPSVCASEPGVEAAVAAADSAGCLAMMEAFPRPRLERVSKDDYTLQSYSYWRVARDGANLYDAPGGPVIGQIPAGFNFVTAASVSADGWVQRQGGEWIKPEDVQPARVSTFSGMLLPAGWRHPFAIILDRTGVHASLRPGAAGSKDSGFVTRRYQLVNIFARAEDDAGKVWYLVGPRQWLRQELVAKFAPAEAPAGVAGRWVAVDLFEQTLIAYEDDQPVFATVISSGMEETQTDEGVYTVWARLRSDGMSGFAGQEEAYALQSVPWVMYFNRGESLHGAYWHDSFGYRRSRGCVNLSVSDARWLYEWMLEAEPNAEGEIVNTVYVFSSGEYEL
ncbi:MAG: L,D-transpeptidase [Chloroflexi bacterium]|nr:L,D-transpeptidase [Chloroflexota bacterium]